MAGRGRSSGGAVATRTARLRWTVRLACAAAAWSGPAIAQEYRTNIRVGILADYQSNLLRSNRLRGGYDGSDVRITPSLDIDIARPIGRDRVSLEGVVGYDLHPRNRYLDRERIRLDADANVGIGHVCRAALGAGIDFQQTDIGDLGERVGNTSRYQTESVAIDCTRKVGFSPTGSFRHTAVDNSLDSRRRYDLRSDEGSLGLAYAKPSLGVVQLFGSVRRIEHPFRPTLTGVGDETRVTSVGVGLRRRVSPRFSGEINVTWLKTDPRQFWIPSFSGVGWRSRLRWTPTPRLTAAALLEREVRGESSFAAAYAIATGGTLDVSYRVGHRLDLSLAVAQRQRRFRGEQMPDGQPPRVRDNTWTLAAGGDYQLFRSVGLRARVDYRRRHGTNPLYSYSSAGGSLGARVRF